MGALLDKNLESVKGRARYLYELSPELKRSLSSRWLRWHRRQWEPADGMVRTTDMTRAALAAERLGARPYSLTALQRYATCPYQFLIAAVYRLSPLEAPAPLQKMDPLTRGDLFHQMQAAALRRWQSDGLLPLSTENLPAAQQRLTTAIREVHDREYDRLSPAIDRVWQDEITAMTQDLRDWLEKLTDEGVDWTPERFEFAFGLADMEGRDEHSTPDPAVIDGRFRLRGSIDMIERHRKTGFLRVTDHKTGKNRTKAGQTVVDGGRVLQPVIYGLALKALYPHETVYSGRLFYCTSAGGFKDYEIPLMGEAPKRGIEVLEIVDRAIEHGHLAAKPGSDACQWCDFQVVCGRDEERRTRRKDPKTFADLDALRKMP
jgi:RecB family exonuclease